MRKKDEPMGGNLTVTISHFSPDSHFSSTHVEAIEKKYWLIRVEDTGVGIEPKNMTKIFDPFFTTKSISKGTGLGLAMAYNIIQQHKGFIEVHSQPGEGTSFDVFIPQLDDKQYVSDKIKPDEKLIKGFGTVLLVDDEETLRHTTREILETIGYDVITAKDGREGVDVFKENNDQVKLVFMDMAMPNMSGKDAYIEMKKINPAVKVLLTSGFKFDQRVKEALALGVNGFIQKPFSMVDLSRRIHEIIHSS